MPPKEPAAAAPAAPAAPGATPAPGDLYKPDGIDAALLGKSNTETIDNLLKINKGFRDAQSKFGSVPEKPDAYALGDLSPELTKKIGADLAKDPVVGLIKNVAHELGIRDKQFAGFVPKIIEGLDKMGLVPDKAAFDPETQIKALEEDHASIADPTQRRIAAAKRIPEAKAKLDNLLAANVLTKPEHQELLSLLPQATTFRLLEKIVGKFTAADGTVVPAGGGGPSAGIGESDITARRMDPRYDSRSPSFNAAFREETDRMWRDLTNRKNPRSA